MKDPSAMIQGLFIYSKEYPKNFRSLSTFSCLTNTVIRRR
jgi:hypothetical protein